MHLLHRLTLTHLRHTFILFHLENTFSWKRKRRTQSSSWREGQRNPKPESQA